MAEKFSRFRDAATGIQVFLTPVPPASSTSPISYLLLPATLALGAVRSVLIALLAGLWTLASFGASLGRGNGFFARAVLALLGFYSIKEEKVSLRSRGRATSSTSSIAFEPKKGDIILANHTSWIDLLYLSARFSPVFVLPIVSPSTAAAAGDTGAASSATSTGTPRRGTPRKNAMSANTRIETPGAEQSTSELREVKGFRRASVWEVIRRSGFTPIVQGKEAGSEAPLKLDQIAESAEAPVVVFPELVTSNNRGLLRFSAVFPASWRLLYRRTGALQIGAGQASLYILSFKHEPPSTLLPTTTHSVPTHLAPTGRPHDLGWNPIRHVWSLVATLPAPRALTVRMLDPTEAPTGSQYLADPSSINLEVLDPLADACATLVASLSRLRRTNLGWEDKEVFLAMMRSRR
ncbi:hypothetical protein ACQY0O_000928 [Thecaphora frezii]